MRVAMSLTGGEGIGNVLTQKFQLRFVALAYLFLHRAISAIGRTSYHSLIPLLARST
jgi:hypothetical protein